MQNDIKKIVAYCKRKYQTDNPFEIADAMNIIVQIGDIGSRSGCYMYLRRNKCVWINENIEGNERKFVMAHELGHAIMHPKQNCYFIKHKTLLLNSRTEMEANKFAVELLIPESELLEYQSWNGFNIEQLSRIFGYQKELIELRLKNL